MSTIVYVQPGQCAVQDFFDLAVNNKTRPQIHEDLAKLAAQASGVSQDAVLEQLSFPPGDPHPGSNISMVCLTNLACKHQTAQD